MSRGLGPDTDAFYTALLTAHEGLDEAESHALNARLILMMADEIGDVARLHELLIRVRALSDEAP